MRQLLIILLLIPLFSLGQADLLPTVAWRTYVRNVEQLTDSTYKFEVMPLDWNQPGAANIDYGNYFQDYGGNKYEVIDSAYLSVTVLDIFETGVSPQVDRIGIMYQSPEPESEYLAPINYQYLDETALDNARAVELAYLWRQANLYAKDSAYLVWWSDTIQNIATKHDLDTLNQKTLDSLLIHRTEIDELKNRSDENSDLHVEVGRLKNLGNHSINVIFSKPFVNQPIGEEPQIYRIEKFKGNYRREKMLWGWTDANQPINTGFSLNIDNSESLANVVIEYTYIELLQDWILKTGFWNMQGTWKMDKTWKF